MAARSVLVLALALSGCALEPIDLANRRCPCIDRWICDEARDLCVAAPRDGDPTDAGAIDAEDAAVEDAAVEDAAVEDAEPCDVCG